MLLKVRQEAKYPLLVGPVILVFLSIFRKSQASSLFKQKTAYEMYICDWSSDVCSSDLY